LDEGCGTVGASKRKYREAGIETDRKGIVLGAGMVQQELSSSELWLPRSFANAAEKGAVAWMLPSLNTLAPS